MMQSYLACCISPAQPYLSVNPALTMMQSYCTPAGVDFSRLTRAQTSARGARERQSALAEVRGKVEELGAGLAKSAPNMKAGEQYQRVLETEKGQQADLDKVRA